MLCGIPWEQTEFEVRHLELHITPWKHLTILVFHTTTFIYNNFPVTEYILSQVFNREYSYWTSLLFSNVISSEDRLGHPLFRLTLSPICISNLQHKLRISADWADLCFLSCRLYNLSFIAAKHWLLLRQKGGHQAVIPFLWINVHPE
jgi:hypothetical protein